MARSIVPVTQLVRNGGTFVSSAGTIDTANGQVINAPSDTLVLYVNNTGPAGTVVFKAGDNPPALRGILGDESIDIGGTAAMYLTFETARFMQDDGTVNIDWGGSPTGSIAAYETRIPGVS